MNTLPEIPAGVAAFIAELRRIMNAEQEERETKEAIDRAAWISDGKHKIAEALADTSIPEWIKTYHVTEQTIDEELIMRIGRGWNSIPALNFRIPGLADVSYNLHGEWKAAHAEWDKFEFPEELPTFYFRGDRREGWTDLEHALISAQGEAVLFETFMEEREKYLEEQARSKNEQHNPTPPAEEKSTEERAWTSQEIEHGVKMIEGDSDVGTDAMQVRALLLIGFQLKRIADVLEENNGESGIAIQVATGVWSGS